MASMMSDSIALDFTGSFEVSSYSSIRPAIEPSRFTHSNILLKKCVAVSQSRGHFAGRFDWQDATIDCLGGVSQRLHERVATLGVVWDDELSFHSGPQVYASHPAPQLSRGFARRLVIALIASLARRSARLGAGRTRCRGPSD